MHLRSNPSGELLFATDLSDGSRRPLAFVKQAARLRRLSVRVIHVLELSEGRGSFSADQVSAERSLRQIAHELRLAGITETATLITAGRAARAIQEATRRYAASLLLLGLPPRSATPHRPFGRTATAILAHAGCPVCIVGPNWIDGQAPADHSLVVVDLAAESLRRSLETWPPSPQFTKVLAVRPPAGSLPMQDPQWPEGYSPFRILEAAAASESILKDAAECRAGLILLSLTASGYLDSFVCGSVAHSIISQSTCPVLLLRGSSVS